MKRKLLGLFTALCLLAASAFSTYAADELFDVTFEDIGDNQPAYAASPGGQQEDGFTGLLTALAIVSENEAASGALLGGAAFGEFAAITSRMAGRTGLGENPSNEYETAASAARQLGYADAGLTAADNLSYNQVLKLVLDNLGYGQMAGVRGGYPNGYRIIGAQLGVTKNIAQDETAQFVTKGAALQMVYNALMVKSLNPAAFAEGSVIYQASEAPILNTVFDTYIYEGVVNGQGKSVIDDYAQQNEQTVIIGENSFFSGKLDFSPVIGMSLSAYVRELDGAQTVIYYEKSSKNAVTTVSLSDVDKAETGTVTYFKGDKQEKLKAPDDAKVLYNGRGTAKNYRELLFQTYNICGVPVKLDGEACFIDNNGDKKADFVVINAAKTYVVGDVMFGKKQQFTDQFVTDFNKKHQNAAEYISFKEDEEAGLTATILQNGRPTTQTAISQNRVVMLRQSQSNYGNALELEIVNTTATGIVSAVKKESVTVGGKTYAYTNYYKACNSLDSSLMPPARMGETVTLALDSYGKIVKLVVNNAAKGQEYAFLLGVSNKLGGGKIKYLNKNAEVCEAQLCADLRINGENASGGLDALAQAGNTPIQIKLDKDGRVKTIDLKTMEQVGAVAYNNGVFTGKARSANYTPTRFANKKIVVGDDTAFLGVGFRLDGSIDRDYFVKLEKNTLENRPGTAELTAYDKMVYVVDYNEQTGEAGMVIVDDLPKTQYEDYVVPYNNNGQRLKENSPMHITDNGGSGHLLLVEEVSEAINDEDEVVLAVTGLYAGEEKTFLLAPDVAYAAPLKTRPEHGTDHATVVQLSPQRMSGGAEDMMAEFPRRFQINRNTGAINTPNDYTMPVPEPGDIVMPSFTKEGYVAEYVFMANADEYPTQLFLERGYRGYMYLGYYFMPIKAISDGILEGIGEDENGQRLEEAPMQNNFQKTITNVPCYQWDFEKKEFTPISYKEMYPSYGKITSPDFQLIKPLQEYVYTVNNNTWCYLNGSWGPKEMVFIDYSEK